MLLKGVKNINIIEKLNEISDYTKNNEYEKIKVATLNIEKEILDNYKSNMDFKRLIDNITFYSNYSFFNTLLVDYQYPDFLDLGTKQKYSKNGYNVLDNAKAINILTPNNETYVKINNSDNEEIKLLSELNNDELKRYNDPNDKSITLHHKDFKGLDILELFDCKDTTMTLNDYKHLDLPALFQSDYNDIYNSFVKAIYADGYKVKYVDNLDSKFSYEKDNKTINIKNGLSSQIKILSLLDVYSNETTSNNFEKELLKHVISKGIGIEDEFDEKHSLLDWYKKTDIKNVDKTLKLLSSKGRKFVNNFNRFFELEPKYYPNENVSLYDDYNLTI